MSFFKKLGAGIKKIIKPIGKVVGGVAKVAGSILPGPIGMAAKTVGNIISPDKVQKIANAVADQGVIKVEKIEETAIAAGATTDQATKVAEILTPALVKQTGATIDDTKSKANITLMSKLKELLSKPIVLLGLAGIAAFFIFGKNKKRRF